MLFLFFCIVFVGKYNNIPILHKDWNFIFDKDWNLEIADFKIITVTIILLVTITIKISMVNYW